MLTNPKILKNPDLRLTESRPCGIVLKDRKAVKVLERIIFSQRREVIGCKLPRVQMILEFPTGASSLK